MRSNHSLINRSTGVFVSGIKFLDRCSNRTRFEMAGVVVPDEFGFFLDDKLPPVFHTHHKWVAIHLK